MKNRYLLTLKDGFNSATGVEISSAIIASASVHLVDVLNDTFYPSLPVDIYSSYPFFEYNENDNKYEDKSNLSKILKYLVNNRWHEYCAFYDNKEEDEAKKLEALRNFFDNFFAIMLETWDRYDTLLTIYENNKSNLLDKVKTLVGGDNSSTSTLTYDSQVKNTNYHATLVESTNKVKDTPQLDITPSDGYNSEVGYANTGTKENGGSTDTRSGSDTTEVEGEHSTTTEEDRDTLMARIDEIDSKYRRLLKDWDRCFDGLFWEEVEDYEE